MKSPGFRALTSGVLLFAFLCCQSQAVAQVLYGQIVGAVKDASGAAVPAATVTVSNKATGQVRETVADEAGNFLVSTLQAGEYEVRIRKDGFRTANETNVGVTSNSVTRIDIALQVGAVSESINVEASAAVLQTDSASVKAEVTSRQLTNLPVPVGRNYQNLLITIPGFNPPNNAHSVPSNPSRALESNVNGTTRSSNVTRIDGVASTNIWLPHIAAYVPSLEAIETVNVVTNSFSAEQGLAGGAAINVQIKSGTNNVHGSGFWYNNNNAMLAKPFFLPQGQRNPKYVFNQMGGTVGGPIVKNKLFFFAAYERTTRREFANTFGSVATAQMRMGDFSAPGSNTIFDPATGDLATGANRTPFPGNMIPMNRQSAITRQIQSGVPLPNVASARVQQNYFATGNFLFDRDTVDTKVNYNVNDRWNMYGRFSVLDYTMDNAGIFGELVGPPVSGAGGNVGTAVGQTYSMTYATNYLIKPNFIIDAYFGFSKMNTLVAQPDLDKNIGRDVLKIPGTNGTREFEGGWPRFTIANFSTLGVPDAFMPYSRRDPQFQYVANATWTKGRHNVKFGFDFANLQLNHQQAEFAGANHGAQGGFNFATGTTGLFCAAGSTDPRCAANVRQSPNEDNSWAGFLLGLPNNYGRILQVDDTYTTRTWNYSYYVQDTWQVSQKLTLNYGTRYELFPFPTRADRGMERYDFAANKMLVCGVGTVPNDCGVKLGKTYFSPRLGIAYRPNDKTVIRSGFGINFDPWNLARSHRTNFPVLVVLNGNSLNAFTPVSRIEEGIPAIPTPTLGNGVIDIPNTYAVTSVGEEFKRSYIMSWNFTIQRQLGKGFTLQAGYVANRQVRQTGNLDLNAGQVIGAGVNGAPFFQRFGRRVQTSIVTPIGHTTYNALQSTLERRFASGFSMNVAYTWSKAMGVCCNANSDGGPAYQALPFYDLNRSIMPFDRTHNVQYTTVYELPFGKGKSFLANGGALAALLGGWQINGLMSIFSGNPFTIGSDGSSLNLPGSSQTADFIGSGKVTKLGGVGQGQPYYDFRAFAPVTQARFGNTRQMLLRGPSIFNSDLGLFRRFNIGERVNVQFRAEALNLTNTPQLGNPSSNISNLRLNPDGSFRSGVFEITGLANTGRDGISQRAFRLGLKLQF